MNTQRPLEPLSPEERDIAALLSRARSGEGPSEALDAAILAMAAEPNRVAAGIEAPASPEVRARRKPARWPVWMGVAASFVAVAGLSWQLLPLLEQGKPVSYETAAHVPADDTPIEPRQPIEYVGTASAAAATVPEPPPLVAEAAPRIEPARAASSPAPERAVARAKSMAASPRPVPAVSADIAGAPEVAAEAVAAPPPPPAPMAAPAPAAAAQVASDAAAPAANARLEAGTLSRQAAAPAPARPKQDASALDTVVVTGTRIEKSKEGDYDVRPPATVASDDVQQAWLQRIREMRDHGKTTQARESLREFVRRNPRTEVPADLKPLLPASTP